MESFLKRQHQKKRKEREDRLQPRITTFFRNIKQEPYDGDDEMLVSQPAIMKPIPVKCHSAPAPSSPISSTVSTPKSFTGSFLNVKKSLSSTSVVDKSSVSPDLKYIGTSKEPRRSLSATPNIICQNSAKVSHDNVIHLSPILFDELVNGAPKSTSEMQTITVEMKNVGAETDGSKTKLPRYAPPEMISQTTETDSRITNLPPTPAEVHNQVSETESCITKILAPISKMISASTETDSAITKSPEAKEKESVISFQSSYMQTEEVPDGNSVDNPVKNKSTHADVQDNMIQTEVDNSNILTVNKIEIVYSMESWCEVRGPKPQTLGLLFILL